MLSELSYKEIEYLVEEYIHNGRNRDIILRKLHNEEITYEKLAEEYELSVTTVKNIVRNARETLCLHIEGKCL